MSSDTQGFTVSRKNKSDFWFAMVDLAVIQDPTIPPMAKVVYMVICEHADIHSRTTTLRQKTIAREVGCSERTVQRSLDFLEERGLIERRRVFENGSEKASIFEIVGYNAPCYQKKEGDTYAGGGDTSAGGGDMGDMTPGDTHVHPSLREPNIYENKETAAPIPEAAAAAAPPPDEPPAPNVATLSKLIDLWNRELVPLGFQKVLKGNPARDKAFHARLEDMAARREMAWWRERIAQIAASEFMRKSAGDKKRWLTLDWLLNETNLVKVMEGRYDDRKGGQLYDRLGNPVPKFSEPEAREFSPEYEAYLEAKYGGGKVS